MKRYNTLADYISARGRCYTRPYIGWCLKGEDDDIEIAARYFLRRLKDSIQYEAAENDAVIELTDLVTEIEPFRDRIITLLRRNGEVDERNIKNIFPIEGVPGTDLRFMVSANGVLMANQYGLSTDGMKIELRFNY